MENAVFSDQQLAEGKRVLMILYCDKKLNALKKLH